MEITSALIRLRRLQRADTSKADLDDKLSAAILMGMPSISKTGKTPKRKVYQYFTVFEEIGHARPVQADVTMCFPGYGMCRRGPSCTEKEVSICTKDAVTVSLWLTTELVKAAREAGVSTH